MLMNISLEVFPFNQQMSRQFIEHVSVHGGVGLAGGAAYEYRRRESSPMQSTILQISDIYFWGSQILSQFPS
jgi:hypothetical protein